MKNLANKLRTNLIRFLKELKDKKNNSRFN